MERKTGEINGEIKEKKGELESKTNEMQGDLHTKLKRNVKSKLKTKKEPENPKEIKN